VSIYVLIALNAALFVYCCKGENELSRIGGNFTFSGIYWLIFFIASNLLKTKQRQAASIGVFPATKK